MIVKKQRTALFASLVLLMPLLWGCGDSSGEQTYFYSVDVVNSADAVITVRYDRDVFVLSSEWLEETHIQPGNSEIVEWSSGRAGDEQMEVEFPGEKDALYSSPGAPSRSAPGISD